MTITMQGLQPITTTVGVDKDAARHARLVDAAQQFEGMLLQEMLKGIQSGKEELGSGESDSGDDSGDTLRSFGTEAVATAIAKGGGVGIARQIVQKVTLESAYSTATKTNSN
ncbi:hypothetical protein [Granulicella arctica]|uniref:Rod binding domain-containing protein n=1 Tax=Granulicella arctica TaxID=940613 RepID=A0A7Y9TLI6_9BACT|nr:hypothetical protein [Granulicella arctica]NYF80157.1 Rod binding domain-containing protein [Granulicella arctica]